MFEPSNEILIDLSNKGKQWKFLLEPSMIVHKAIDTVKQVF